MSFPNASSTDFLQPRFGQLPPEYEDGGVPERVALTNAEQQEALVFEHRLFVLPLTGEDVSENGAVGRTVGESLSAFQLDDKQCPPFFLSYFLQSDGRVVEYGDGETHEIPPLSTAEDVREWFSRSAVAGIPREMFHALAKNSQKFFADQAVEKLAQGIEEPIDDRYELFNIDPATTVTQLTDFLRARNVLRREGLLLADDVSNLGDAKRAILEIYIAKINHHIADYLPRAAQIVEQAQYEQQAYEPLMSAMIASMPKSLAQLIIGGVDRRSVIQRFEHRLDLLRNGLANTPSALSSAVDTKLLDYTPAKAEQSEHSVPLFSAEEITILQNTIISPENGALFIRALLDKNGRHDWPVVPNPTKNTYEASPGKGMFLNTTIERSALELLVVGMIHEPIHIDQKVNADALAEVFKIAGLGGKRSGGIREEGAMREQRRVSDIFIGQQSHAPNLQYARAVHALEQGGGPLDAVEQFLPNNSVGATKVRAAVDRVIRLIRKGENTQPMVYAEGYLLDESLHNLEQQYPEVGVHHTTFDIPDQLRLARFGLLPETTENHSTLQRATTVLSVVNEILSSHPELHELDALRSIDWSSKSAHLSRLTVQ